MAPSSWVKPGRSKLCRPLMFALVFCFPALCILFFSSNIPDQHSVQQKLLYSEASQSVVDDIHDSAQDPDSDKIQSEAPANDDDDDDDQGSKFDEHDANSFPSDIDSEELSNEVPLSNKDISSTLKKQEQSQPEFTDQPREDVVEKPAISTLKFSRTLSPYSPITQHLHYADPPLSKSQVDELMRQGYGLKPIKLKGGIRSWKENEILYVPPNMTTPFRAHLAKIVHPLFYPIIPYQPDIFFMGNPPRQGQPLEKKIILGKTAGLDSIHKLSPLRTCPDFPCVLTTNFTYLQNASAVIFNGERMKGPPPARRPDQMFIFYLYEPEQPSWSSKPAFHNKKYRWGDAFNWTMSYHLDADFVMPYGQVRPLPVPEVKDYKAILQKKTKKVAWMVSHCPTFSKREEYVKEMQKYIPVDIYGGCGPFKCGRYSDLACLTNISDTYKFYLAFENAQCPDYVTEKLMKYLRMDVLLVVRGDRNGYRYIPKDIFIDAGDFESPKALAERLLHLDKHDDEYIDLLRKKSQYFVSYDTYPHMVGSTVWIKFNWETVPLCDMCHRLWNLDKYSGHYQDIEKWFNDRLCRPPTDIIAQ